MTKEEALQKFYECNHICAAEIFRYQDPLLSKLPQKIDEWLGSIQPEDHELFLRMLSGYTYVTNEMFVCRYGKAVDMLEERLRQHKICLRDVLFVTMRCKDFAKAGCENVRTDFHRFNADRIDANQIVSLTERSKGEYQDFAAVVFLDDIVATGFTMWKIIEFFLENYPHASEKPLYYICAVPTKSGVRFLQRKFRENQLVVEPVYCEKWKSFSLKTLKQCLFSEEWPAAEARILEYETRIDSYMKEKEEPSYIWGFRQCKQLVSFYYNTPNNTLCSFWKETDDHTPLFRRQKQRRPRLPDLQNTKKETDDRAYEVKKELRRKANETPQQF